MTKLHPSYCSHEVRVNGVRRTCLRNTNGEHEGYPYCWQHLRHWTRLPHLSRPLMMIAMAEIMKGDMLVADRVFRLVRRATPLTNPLPAGHTPNNG